jgi:O-antigen ligase
VKATSAPDTGLLLAGSMCLLPFVLPYHQQPVLTFFLEWLAVALGVTAGMVVLASRQFTADAALSAPAFWFTAFALFVLLQAALRHPAYLQIPLLATLYLLYALLVIQLAGQLVAMIGFERVAITLATFILAGALANCAFGVIQFYGRPKFLEDVVAELLGARAYGNIAQPNLYANYLALGQAALIFLWLRARLRTSYALAALALLAVATALSGSRGALIYSAWFAITGVLTGRVLGNADGKRLQQAVVATAVAVLAAQIAIPWANLVLHLGPSGEAALNRLLIESGHGPRLPVLLLALRIFTDSPIAGTGIGEFAGAAFNLGLGPEATAVGEVWTSPHNLPLHLLAETGLPGAILVLGGLTVWAVSLGRRYRTDASPALWWIVAAAGVELIHSLVEYPLWNAHFLGLTALLIGTSTVARTRSATLAAAARITGIASCAVLIAALAVLLRDFVRLDMTRATGTTATLAPAAQVQRDSATMQRLRGGLLSPVAELWIFVGTPLDRQNLADKLAMGERVAHFWPANIVIVRRAIFLALDGRSEEARALINKAVRSFPQRRKDTVTILERAFERNPAAIAPLLMAVRNSGSENP